MLAFLIGTTILNLFLGYALAVYLMRASQTGEYRPQLRPADRPGSVAEATPSLFAAATGETTATLVQASNQNAPATVTATSGTNAGSTATTDLANTDPATLASATEGDAATQSTGAEELDQQLLAGIADFRSQLAKLRSETGQPEEGKRRPVARK